MVLEKEEKVSDKNELEIQEYIEKAKSGDEEAFRAIFEMLSGELFSYALSHAKSREDALDIVQETFIELWKALPKFSYSGRHKFYGFVYIILKRRLYRSYKRAVASVELEEHHISDTYEMEVEDYRHLHRLLTKLPQRYQELLRLRYWSSLSFREIAGYMNIKEATAKVWHHRAMKEIRQRAQYLA